MGHQQPLAPPGHINNASPFGAPWPDEPHPHVEFAGSRTEKTCRHSAVDIIVLQRREGTS